MGTRSLGERSAGGSGREKVATGTCYVYSVNLLLRKDVILTLGPFRLLEQNARDWVVYKQQNLISQFWSLDVRDHGASTFWFSI